MVSELNIFAQKWSKIAKAKKVVYGFLFICSLCSNIFWAPLSRSPMSTFSLDFKKPWGKLMERSGLRFKYFVHKGYKITAYKSWIFDKFCLTSRIFFGIGATIRIGREMLCLLFEGFFFTEWRPDLNHYSVLKSTHKSSLFRRESISKMSWGVSAFVFS